MDAQPRIDTGGQQQGRGVNLAGQPRRLAKRIFQWFRKINLTGGVSATIRADYIVEHRAQSGLLVDAAKRTYIDTDDGDAVKRTEIVERMAERETMAVQSEEGPTWRSGVRDSNADNLKVVKLCPRDPGGTYAPTVQASFAAMFADHTLTGSDQFFYPRFSAAIFHRLAFGGKNYVADLNIPIAGAAPADWIGVRVRSSNTPDSATSSPLAGIQTGFLAEMTHFDATDGGRYKVNGTQVVGAQQDAIGGPSGQSVDLDAEARASIELILTALRTHGLIAPSP